MEKVTSRSDATADASMTMAQTWISRSPELVTVFSVTIFVNYEL